MRILLLLFISLTFIIIGYGQYKAQAPLSEKTRSEKWIEDIDYFEDEFLNNAKTYTKDSSASCKAILSNLKIEIDKLSDFQITLALSKCVVMADNGHTTLVLPKMDKIPLRFYRFSDGLYVVKTDKESSKYLGSKVLKINSIPIDEVAKRIYPYLSGIEAWKKFKTLDLMASPKILREIGVSKGDSLIVTLAQNNNTLDVSFEATQIENDRYWFEAWADLSPNLTDENNWQFIHKDKNDLPLYLKKSDKGVFYSFIDDEKIAYFHINGFWNKCSDFKGKIDDFLEILKTKRDYNAIVDLRFYTGGNYGLPIKLATGPPKIINANKKIYLITSHKTYSAGIVTAARIKYYAKDKIVIVGEEVGDKLKFWAESELCKLPNSNLRIYNSLKEHDWKDNKRNIFKTHLPNFLYGVAVKDLKVGKKIELSFADFNDNKDPILEWIMNNQE